MWIQRMGLALLVVAAGMGRTAEALPDAPAERIESWWADLASPNEAIGAAAVIGLSGEPESATALFAARLKPVNATRARLGELIEKLGSDDRTERRLAREELEGLGSYAVEDLERAVQGGLDRGVEREIRSILDRLPKRTGRAGRGELRGSNVAVSNNNGVIEIKIDGRTIRLDDLDSAEDRKPDPFCRALRAIAILEHLGSDEAKRILEEMAEGEPDAPPTREARLALDRLAEKR